MYKGEIYNEMDREYNEVMDYVRDVTSDNRDKYDEVDSNLFMDLEAIGEDLQIDIWDLTLDKLIDILYDTKLL